MLRIDITNDGESWNTVDLNGAIVILVLKHNYHLECWYLDIYDSNNNLLLAGLMLVPNIDILAPYQQLKLTLGSLVLIEKNAGDYKLTENFGTNTNLLWFEPEEEIILPEF